MALGEWLARRTLDVLDDLAFEAAQLADAGIGRVARKHFENEIACADAIIETHSIELVSHSPGQTHRVMVGSLEPVMTLASEIRGIVEQCVRGELGVHEMDRGLAAYVRPIGRAKDDAEARRLYGRARALDSELGYGHRTEESVRSELRQLLEEIDATFHRQAGARP